MTVEVLAPGQPDDMVGTADWLELLTVNGSSRANPADVRCYPPSGAEYSRDIPIRSYCSSTPFRSG